MTPLQTGTQAQAAPPTYSGPTFGAVQPQEETIEGRLQGLLGSDAQGNYTNPVVQQSANRATQSMAGRGLLNSSMAQQAAIEAAIGKGIDIASPDAQTYFSQRRANQDTANVYSRDGNQRTFEGSQNDLNRAQSQNQFNVNSGLERDRITQNQNQFNVNSGLERDRITQNQNQFNVTEVLNRDRMRAEVTATALGRTHEASIRNIDAVNRQFEMYTNSTFQIDQNRDMTAEAKAAAKNEAGATFDTFARNANVVWATLGGRFAVAAPAPAPEPAPVQRRRSRWRF